MYKVFGILSLSVLSTIAFSKNDIEINGLYKLNYSNKASMQLDNEIGVMKFNLSDHAKQKIKERLNPRALKHDALEKSDTPVSINLGMNGAPVLNQGHHGSCVTFANTGAVNAALGHGDGVSQLCNLALGMTFANDGFQWDGWNGSLGPMVLGQLTNFGFVSKDDQRTYGCGGLNEYPLQESESIVKPMPLKDFHEHAQNLFGKIGWSSILSPYDWLEGEYCPERFLKDVKRSLADKHRVTFGMLLDPKVGRGGAAGHYKSETNFDTWMLTPEIIKHIKEGTVDAGHELVIYGYDDDAQIGDQKGILYIRNSWSERAGHHGNYFMTYDYFKALAYEGQKILVLNGDIPPAG